MPIDNRVATNQPPPLVGHNVVTGDDALVDAVTRHASSEVVAEIAPIGEVAGSAEAREHGMLANEFHPELTPYDRYGNRIDEVQFHPSRQRRGSPTARTRTSAGQRASSRGRRPSRGTAARSR